MMNNNQFNVIKLLVWFIIFNHIIFIIYCAPPINRTAAGVISSNNGKIQSKQPQSFNSSTQLNAAIEQKRNSSSQNDKDKNLFKIVAGEHNEVDYVKSYYNKGSKGYDDMETFHNKEGSAFSVKNDDSNNNSLQQNSNEHGHSNGILMKLDKSDKENLKSRSNRPSSSIRKSDRVQRFNKRIKQDAKHSLADSDSDTKHDKAQTLNGGYEAFVVHNDEDSSSSNESTDNQTKISKLQLDNVSTVKYYPRMKYQEKYKQNNKNDENSEENIVEKKPYKNWRNQPPNINHQNSEESSEGSDSVEDEAKTNCPVVISENNDTKKKKAKKFVGGTVKKQNMNIVELPKKLQKNTIKSKDTIDTSKKVMKKVPVKANNYGTKTKTVPNNQDLRIKKSRNEHNNAAIVDNQQKNQKNTKSNTFSTGRENSKVQTRKPSASNNNNHVNKSRIRFSKPQAIVHHNKNLKIKPNRVIIHNRQESIEQSPDSVEQTENIVGPSDIISRTNDDILEDDYELQAENPQESDESVQVTAKQQVSEEDELNESLQEEQQSSSEEHDTKNKKKEVVTSDEDQNDEDYQDNTDTDTAVVTKNIIDEDDEDLPPPIRGSHLKAKSKEDLTNQCERKCKYLDSIESDEDY